MVLRSRKIRVAKSKGVMGRIFDDMFFPTVDDETACIRDEAKGRAKNYWRESLTLFSVQVLVPPSRFPSFLLPPRHVEIVPSGKTQIMFTAFDSEACFDIDSCFAKNYYSPCVAIEIQ